MAMFTCMGTENMENAVHEERTTWGVDAVTNAMCVYSKQSQAL